MRRRIPTLILALSLLLAACATAGDNQTTTSEPSAPGSSTSTEAPGSSDESTTSTDATDEGSGETTTTEGTSEKPEGPSAPDFSLALGEDGSEAFMLSQEVMPVFMVFWAEW